MRAPRRRLRGLRQRPLHGHHGPAGLRESTPHALPRRARLADASGGVYIGETYLATLNDRQLTELARCTETGFIFQATALS